MVLNYILVGCPWQDHSTELAILEIGDNLKTAIDKNLITCGLFLDFSEPFDTVNHEIMLVVGFTIPC